MTAYAKEKIGQDLTVFTCLVKAKRKTHIDLLTKFFLFLVLINLCLASLGRIVRKTGSVTHRVLGCFLR